MVNELTPSRLTRGQAAEFLKDRGYPISLSTLRKLSMPSCGCGPPIDCWFGKRPLYRPNDLIEWAEARCRPGEQGRRAASGVKMPRVRNGLVVSLGQDAVMVDAFKAERGRS
jgi:hypothetical protein